MRRSVTAAMLARARGPGPPRARIARNSTRSSTDSPPGRWSCPARMPGHSRTASTPGRPTCSPAMTSSKSWSSGRPPSRGSSSGPIAPMRPAWPPSSSPRRPRRRSGKRTRPPRWANGSSGTPGGRCRSTLIPSTASRTGPASPPPGSATTPTPPHACSSSSKSTAAGCRWLLERWGELGALLDRGLSWQSPDKLKAIRLLGRQPLDAADSEVVALIFQACHVLDPQPGHASGAERSQSQGLAEAIRVLDVMGKNAFTLAARWGGTAGG